MGEETQSSTFSKTKVSHITTANNLAKPLWYVITSHFSRLNQHNLYTNHPQVENGELITTHKDTCGYMVPISEIRSLISSKISFDSNVTPVLWFLAIRNPYFNIFQMKLFLCYPPITENNSTLYRPRLEVDILTTEELRHELIRIKSYEHGLGSEQMRHRLRNFQCRRNFAAWHDGNHSKYCMISLSKHSCQVNHVTSLSPTYSWYLMCLAKINLVIAL